MRTERHPNGAVTSVALRLALFLAASVWFLPVPAAAQVTWTSTTGGNWSTTTNWGNGTAPASGGSGDLFFNASSNVAVTATNNLTSYTAGNITFNTGSFTLTGSAIALTGSVTTLASNLQTMSLGIDLGSSDRTFNIFGSNFVLNGRVFGTGGIVKTGNGTLILDGTNDFSGNMSVQAGNLRLGNNNANATVPSGTISLAGSGRLVIAYPSGNRIFNNTITTSATTSSGGALSIEKGGTSTFRGNVQVYTVTSNTSTTGTAGPVTFEQGKLTLGGTYATGASTTGTTAPSITVWGAPITITSTISYGPGASSSFMTKSGTGTLYMGNAAATDINKLAVGGGTLDIVGTLQSSFKNAGIQFTGTSDNVLQMSGTYAPSTWGGAPFQVGWNSSSNDGGFAARGGALTVTIAGGGTATYQAAASFKQSDGMIASGRTLIFGSPTADDVVTLTNPLNFNSGTQTIKVIGNANANNYAVLSGALSNGGLTKDGTGLLRLTGTSTYAGATAVNSGTLAIGSAGQLVGTTGTYAGDMTVAASTAFRYDSSANSTLSGVISGAGAVVQSGAGTVRLLGSNSYNGGTTLSAGTVRAENTSALGGGSVTLAGGSLALANDAASTFGSGNGYAITVIANSTIAIDRTSSGAAVTHQLGSLSIGNQTLSVTRGSNNASGTAGLTFSGAATVSGAAALDVAENVNIRFDGASGFSGAGTLTKTGAGSLTLASQGHAGGFVINQGRLNIAAANVLGNAGSLTLASGVSLDNTSGAGLTLGSGRPIALGTSLTFVGSNSLNLGTGTTTLSGATTLNIAANTLTLGGDVTGGTYDLIKTGAGTLELAGLSGGSSYSGNTDIQAGRLLLSGTSQFANNTWVYVKNGATLEVGSSASVSNVNVNVASGGAIVTNAVVSGNIRFAGDQTLTANTNYNGTQTIGSGAVVSMAADYLGTTPATATIGRIVLENGGTLRATQAFTINANKGIALNSGSATFNADFSTGSGVTVESVISGLGTLVKTGSGGFQLKNTSNSYSGGTVVEAGGTLGIWGDGSLGQAGTDVRLNGGTLNSGQNTSAVSVAGRTIYLGAGVESGIDAFGGTGTSATGTFTVAANIVGGSTATLRINSSGKRQGVVVLSSSNAYTGATRIEAGKLAVNGSVAGSVQVDSGAQLGGSGRIAGNLGGAGLIGPGNSPGILTVEGQVNPTGGASFAFELSGTGAPAWITATASVNDVLRLTSASPFTTSLSDANVVNIYFEMPSLTNGATFLGGFFVDNPSSTAGLLETGLGTATFNYFVWGDGNGNALAYNGKGYYTLAQYIAANTGLGITGVSRSVVNVASADFSSGTITTGQVTQFVIIPEPDTIIFAGIGVAMAGWSLWKRRRTARIVPRLSR